MPAPKTSKRPKARSSAPKKSLRPKARPEMIGASRSGGTRGIDPKENYSAEDFKKLVGKKAYGGKVKKMASGGKCRGMGAATRGGAYKMG